MFKHLRISGFFCFTIGLLSTITLIHVLNFSPRTYVFLREEKLRCIAENKEIDSVVLGSSRILRGFDPRDIVTEFEEPMCAFNGALRGSGIQEQEYLRRQIVRMRSDIEWIFIHIDTGLNFQPENFFTSRNFVVYDEDLLRLSLKLAPHWDYFNTPISMTEKRTIGRYGFICTAYLLNRINFGKYSANIVSLRPSSPIIEALLYKGRMGYLPNGMNFSYQGFTPGNAPQSREYIERFLENLTYKKFEYTDKELIGLHTYAEYLAQYNKTNDITTRYAFFTSPTVKQSKIHIKYPESITESGIEFPIFHIADSHKYPELYQISNFNDISHLNSVGANIFSRLLWEAFTDYLKNENK